MYTTNHFDKFDEIDEIYEITFPYTIKTNIFSLLPVGPHDT